MDGRFKIGDKYWTFYTCAELYNHIWWEPVEIKEFVVRFEYEMNHGEQDYYFATKNEAIDWVKNHFESMRDKGENHGS